MICTIFINKRHAPIAADSIGNDEVEYRDLDEAEIALIGALNEEIPGQWVKRSDWYSNPNDAGWSETYMMLNDQSISARILARITKHPSLDEQIIDALERVSYAKDKLDYLLSKQKAKTTKKGGEYVDEDKG